MDDKSETYIISEGYDIEEIDTEDMIDKDITTQIQSQIKSIMLKGDVEQTIKAKLHFQIEIKPLGIEELYKISETRNGNDSYLFIEGKILNPVDTLHIISDLMESKNRLVDLDLNDQKGNIFKMPFSKLSMIVVSYELIELQLKLHMKTVR